MVGIFLIKREEYPKICDWINHMAKLSYCDSVNEQGADALSAAFMSNIKVK
jgi:hypothetical protein